MRKQMTLEKRIKNFLICTGLTRQRSVVRTSPEKSSEIDPTESSMSLKIQLVFLYQHCVISSGELWSITARSGHLLVNSGQ